MKLSNAALAKLAELMVEAGIDTNGSFATEVEGKPAVGLVKDGHVERVTEARLLQGDPEYIAYLKQHWGAT